MHFLNRLLDRFRVCYEASNGHGRFFELLTTEPNTLLSHIQVAQDRLSVQTQERSQDIEKLAKLLYVDQVPAVYVPSANVRA